jgi:hypothetical protein
VALFLCFGVSGWLLGLAVVPGRLGLPTRLWLSLALSVTATVGLAVPAVLVHQLDALPILVGFLVLAVLAAIRVSRARRAARGAPRAADQAHRAPERPQGATWWAAWRSGGWRTRRVIWRALTLVAAAVLGWVALLGPQLAAASPTGLLSGTTVWYYYRLVLEMVAARGVPATIGEWGAQRPYPVEYLATTVHTAAAAMLAGGADLPFLEGYRLAVLLAGTAAAYALWRRWLPAWWAWVAALVTMSASRLSSRFIGYRPETFGLVLVLWSAWLLDEAIQRRSLRWGALAGVVSGVAFHAHAEVWLITGPLWGGIIAGRAVVEWWRRATAVDRAKRAATTPTTGVAATRATATTAAPPRAAATTAAPTSSAATAVAGASSAEAAPPVVAPRGSSSIPAVSDPVPDTIAGRRRRWQPSRSRSAEQVAGVLLMAAIGFAFVAGAASLVGTGGRIASITAKPTAAAGAEATCDPTWEFFAAINDYAPSCVDRPQTFWDPLFRDPATLWPFSQLRLDPFVYDFQNGRDVFDPSGLIVTLGALLVLLVEARWGTPRLHRQIVTWIMFGVGVLLGAFVIWRLYDTYVPQRAVPRRILAFWTISLAGLYATAALLLVRRGARLLRRFVPAFRSRARRRWRSLMVRGAGLVVAAAVALWFQPNPMLLASQKNLSPEAYAAMTWMHDNLPHDAVVMANTYTDGSVGTVTGMIGWTDGRAPYLEDPEWLATATRHVRFAKAFYYDPGYVRPPAGVDYILAGRDQDLAGYATWEVYWEGLATSPDLELVKSFRENALMLYRVIPDPGGG